jgi:hypothetical protein
MLFVYKTNRENRIQKRMCIILKIVGLVEKADKEKVFEAKNWK